jgi:catalase
LPVLPFVSPNRHAACRSLLAKAGIADSLDEGILPLPGEDGLSAFVTELGKLRVWGREPPVKLGKASTPIS